MSSSQQLLLGEGAGGVIPAYIEEVFSTYVYTGTGSAQTITNGIDLSTKGGLVWLKARNQAYTAGHVLTDTVRGAGNLLRSQTTNGNEYDITQLSAFTSSGFTLGTGVSNISPTTYVSWTFREQPKFFDVVTYTGTGSNTTIAHNLGSVPGCIIVKRTSTGGTNWAVYHRSLANTEYILLNTTAAKATGATYWNSTTPTSTVFSLGTDAAVNGSGSSYVAYIFAHDAGGFGLTGSDNVISCGSASATGVTAVSLGYEPQFCMLKRSSGTGGWFMTDTMRGWNMQGDFDVRANSSDAETDRTGSGWFPSATGFTFDSAQLSGSGDFIYIAIRRGPMKVPTDGTSVFAPAYYSSGLATGTKSTTNFPVDMQMVRYTPGTSSINSMFVDRLRGVSSTSGTVSGPYLVSSSTAAETTSGSNGWDNTGFYRAGGFGPSDPSVYHSLGRAPGYMDVCCYTGTGVTRTVAHNLTVVPELMIFKVRGSTGSWQVYAAPLGATNALILESTNASAATSNFNNTAPTSSVFSVGSFSGTNGSGLTYVNYLFASAPGVSKVGSYTGNGSNQTINCGFTGGARFVLIKRTDSTGDWYVWDTARGMVSGTDPSLLMNSTAAEVNANSVYTATTGFQIVSTASGINASGGTYIFLAIA